MFLICADDDINSKVVRANYPIPDTQLLPITQLYYTMFCSFYAVLRAFRSQISYAVLIDYYILVEDKLVRVDYLIL